MATAKIQSNGIVVQVVKAWVSSRWVVTNLLQIMLLQSRKRRLLLGNGIDSRSSCTTI
jgi:hypothetical protein